MKRLMLGMLVMLGGAAVSEAQVLVTTPVVQPVTSFYVPAAPVMAAPVVAPAPVFAAPVAPVQFYVPPAPVVVNPVVVAPAPAVAMYPQVPIGVPATVRRGLFGRTVVRTPFYTVRY